MRPVFFPPHLSFDYPERNVEYKTGRSAPHSQCAGGLSSDPCSVFFRPGVSLDTEKGEASNRLEAGRSPDQEEEKDEIWRSGYSSGKK
jgi:hypothetical protein